MKRILTIILAIGMFAGVAATELFAEANASPAFGAFAAVSRPAPKRRRARRAGTNIPYLKNSRPIRVRRLSRREVRDVYRRLIDIQIN